MRGDHKVHAPIIEARHHLGLLRRRDAAREEFESEWIRRKTATEGFDVLQRQDGGGDEERHLAPGFQRGEGGAQRHLGLPVANVAHNDAIHRPCARKVALGRLNCGELIWCLTEGEGRLEFDQPR